MIFNRTTRTLVAVALFVTMAGATLAQQIVTDGGRSYKLHTVAKGESFYRLCLDYEVTQEDIISANPSLKNTGLVEGVVLRIPMKMKSLPQTPVTYTVKKGDTAYSIARSYGLTYEKLLSLNPGIEHGIREGDVLKLSAATGGSEPKAMVEYTVVKGDTMFGIAQRNGLTVAQLLALNPSIASGIKAGDVLKLPSSSAQAYVLHVIQAGETLYSIGRRYGVKAQQIIDANVVLNPASLPVGTAIRIPQSQIPTEDEAFFYHRMAQGETLFSLCMKYNVSQEKIKDVNKGVDWNSLRIGQVIAVPKELQTKTQYSDYEVGRRETLFSIAKHQGVSVDDILKANDGLTADNLKRGMIIKIPHTVKADNVTPATTDTSYIGNVENIGDWGQDYDYDKAGRPELNVFLMLPFNAYAELNDLRQSGVNTNNQSYNFKTRRYVEFYEGVRMALDSLSQAGANIRLKVLDTNNRLEAINQLNTATAKPDIIIGPARKGEMADVMRYANDRRVPVVLPFAQCDSTILENPYIFQASVIDTISGKEILTQMVSKLTGHNVIMIKTNTKSAQYKFRTQTLRTLCARAGVQLSEHEYKTSEPTKFLELLTPDKSNIVIFPSNNEAQVNSVLTSLAGVVEQKPEAKVELWATSEWLSFETIEIEVFHRLNTRIYTTFAVDDTGPLTRHGVNKYRRLYFTEPIAFTPYFQKLKPMSGFSEYGLWGYDIALKFVGALVKQGPAFVRDVNAYRPHLLQSNFHFRSLTNWGGAVNVGLKTITFSPDGSVSVANVGE